MFIVSEKIKVNIADYESNPVSNSNSFLRGKYVIGIMAYGQIEDDVFNKQYTAFVTTGNVIDVCVTIPLTDDEDYMYDQFDKTVEKFNKINKHVAFGSAQLTPTNFKSKCNIIIQYYNDRQDKAKEHFSFGYGGY